VPPFWHGADAHSSTLLAHRTPDQPAAHVQNHEFTWSTHVPPFVHGLDAHSSMFVVHSTPDQPAAHRQKYEFT
jgi:hypothetical protein